MPTESLAPPTTQQEPTAVTSRGAVVTPVGHASPLAATACGLGALDVVPVVGVVERTHALIVPNVKDLKRSSNLEAAIIKKLNTPYSLFVSFSNKVWYYCSK